MRVERTRLLENVRSATDGIDNAETYIDHFDIFTCGSRARILFPVFPLQNCSPAMTIKLIQIEDAVSQNPDAPVFIQLDSGDDHIAGVHTNRSSGAIRLVAVHTVNVNNPFLAIHLSDLALPTLVCTPNYPHLIIFANG